MHIEFNISINLEQIKIWNTPSKLDFLIKNPISQRFIVHSNQENIIQDISRQISWISSHFLSHRIARSLPQLFHILTSSNVSSWKKQFRSKSSFYFLIHFQALHIIVEAHWPSSRSTWNIWNYLRDGKTHSKEKG